MSSSSSSRLTQLLNANRRVLLVGPPGCAKTARVAAAALDCNRRLVVFRSELATEREKVRVLQEAMKFSANKDKYFQAQFDPCQRASAALAATEGKP